MDAALNPRPSPYSAVAPGFVTGTNRMMRDDIPTIVVHPQPGQ